MSNRIDPLDVRPIYPDFLIGSGGKADSQDTFLSVISSVIQLKISTINLAFENTVWGML